MENKEETSMENKVIEIEEKELERIIKESVKLAMNKAYAKMTEIMETPEPEKEEEPIEDIIRKRLLDTSFKVPNVKDINLGDYCRFDEEGRQLLVSIEKKDGEHVIEISACQEDYSKPSFALSLEQAEGLLDYMHDACRVVARYYVAKNPENPFGYTFTIRNYDGYCIGVRRLELPDDADITLHVRDNMGQFLGYMRFSGAQYEKIYNVMTKDHYKRYSLRGSKYKIIFISEGKHKAIIFTQKDYMGIDFPLTDEIVKELLEVLK